MSLPHQNLVAWQRADDLLVEIHELTRKRFPREELFELGSQIRRSAFSVAANIVEGMARGTGADRARFLKIARGSLTELGYSLHVAMRLGYLRPEELETFEQKLRAIGGPLQGLIRKSQGQ